MNTNSASNLVQQTHAQSIELVLDIIARAIVDRLQHVRDEQHRLLDAEHAAAYLGVSEPTITRLKADGDLSEVRIRGAIRYDVRDLDSLIVRLKAARHR